MAPHQTIEAAFSFNPIQTWPSMICWVPASTGMSATGRYLLLILSAFHAVNAPPAIRRPPVVKLTGSEKHIWIYTSLINWQHGACSPETIRFVTCSEDESQRSTMEEIFLLSCGLRPSAALTSIAATSGVSMGFPMAESNCTLTSVTS